MNANDDYKLKQYGIGFTNFVARCTKGSVEFSRYEMRENWLSYDIYFSNCFLFNRFFYV